MTQINTKKVILFWEKLVEFVTEKAFKLMWKNDLFVWF